MKHIAIAQLLCVSGLAFLLGACTGSAESDSSNQSTAGSTATILPHGDVAYSLDAGFLKVIDLAQNPPKLISATKLNSPETLFISEGHLYVGGFWGVDIFDIADPLNPVDVADYLHMKACDPIIVEDGVGYITLRAGFANRCQLAGPNRLEVVDMTEPTMPELISEYTMSNPYGLALTETHLAVCEEAFGLTLLDVNDPLMISTSATFPDINCFDLIHQDGRLIATATDGIYQFKAESEFLSLLSKIPVGAEPQSTEL